MAYGICIKNKSSDTMLQAFKELFQKTGSFIKLQTNSGTEFINKKLQTFLEAAKD